MTNLNVTITTLPITLTIHHFPQKSTIPQLLLQSPSFFSITKTTDELSIVCDESIDLESEKADKGWKAIKIQGPLQLDQVGIIAKFSKLLAQADIPIFVISTYETDYVLVKNDTLKKTINLLSSFCTFKGKKQLC